MLLFHTKTFYVNLYNAYSGLIKRTITLYNKIKLRLIHIIPNSFVNPNLWLVSNFVGCDLLFG